MAVIFWFIIAMVICKFIAWLCEEWFDWEVSEFLVILVIWCFLPNGCDSKQDEVDDILLETSKQVQQITQDLAESEEYARVKERLQQIADDIDTRHTEAKKRAISDETADVIEIQKPLEDKTIPTEKVKIEQEEYTDEGERDYSKW